MNERTNRQYAPYPVELEELVNSCEHEDGWTFYLQNLDRDEVDGKVVGGGLTLVIVPLTTNSYHPEAGRTYRVNHYFIVPAATYDRRAWRRWLFDRIIDVHIHEAMEFFQVDGERPYAPSHGPGNDPYMIREVGTDTDQKTSFLGVVKA